MIHLKETIEESLGAGHSITHWYCWSPAFDPLPCVRVFKIALKYACIMEHLYGWILIHLFISFHQVETISELYIGVIFVMSTIHYHSCAY